MARFGAGRDTRCPRRHQLLWCKERDKELYKIKHNISRSLSGSAFNFNRKFNTKTAV
jgi:hypothetical protein